MTKIPALPKIPLISDNDLVIIEDVSSGLTTYGTIAEMRVKMLVGVTGNSTVGNIDGGNASSVYTINQTISGGNAS